MRPYHRKPTLDGKFDIYVRNYRSDDFSPLKAGPFDEADAAEWEDTLGRSFAWGEADDWAGWMA
jgi:hypothetical protein